MDPTNTTETKPSQPEVAPVTAETPAAPSTEAQKEEQPEPPVVEVTSAEHAAEVREESLKNYNAGEYLEALRKQCGVLKFFTEAYGEMDPRCGLAYLDYGLTLLGMLQSTDSEMAALGRRDSEDEELCFLNLDAARVCFDKAVKAAPEDKVAQRRLAEVYDALAQFYLEQGDEDAAKENFETALSGLKAVVEPGHRMLAALLFSLASCDMRSEKFEDAQRNLEEALQVAEHGAVSEEMVTEIKQFLEECKEHRANPEAMKQAKEQIHELFPDDEASCAGLETIAQPNRVGMAPLPPGETSNSNSVTFFPAQGAAPTVQPAKDLGDMSALPTRSVNVASVRKKVRPAGEPITGTNCVSMSETLVPDAPSDEKDAKRYKIEDIVASVTGPKPTK